MRNVIKYQLTSNWKSNSLPNLCTTSTYDENIYKNILVHFGEKKFITANLV